MRFRCLPRALFLAIACVAPVPALAADSAADPVTVRATALLERLGLVRRAPAPAEAPAPAATPAPAPVVASTPRVPPPPADAYQRLQRHGLLDAPPAPVAPQHVAPEATTAAAAPATPSSEAYSVLQKLGLLEADRTPPATAAAPAALVETVPVAPAAEDAVSATAATTIDPQSPAEPASLAASALEKPPEAELSLSEPLSRAYQLLREKGLLPGGPVKSAAKTHAVRRHAGAERVLVDKSERKLFLFKGGRPYREYRISLGGMPEGHKQRAGDLRTPEGVYTLDWRNPRSRYYKSIHISYPNEQDRMRAAQMGVDPGGNIMIHGEHYSPSLKRTLRRARTPKDWTEGCIAMNNEHIDEIWQEVLDGTPIEIRP